MKLVMVSKQDAWKLETSMFCVEGSWETGYEFNAEIFFMLGIDAWYEEDSCWPIDGTKPVQLNPDGSVDWLTPEEDQFILDFLAE
jgi:hypothetical protein